MTVDRDAREEAMSELAAALLDAVDERSLDQLAMALAPRLGMLVGESVSVAPWLDALGAAERLALSRATIHELPDSAGIVELAVGSLRRKTFVVVIVAAKDDVRSGGVEQL